MISTFLDPTQLPSRTQDQKIFDILMGQLMQLLPVWGGEINAALGQFNAGLAGGAYALPYVFDAATADADPGAGKLRLSSVAQNSATVMRLDVLAGGQDVTSILDKFDASTSDVKGSIRLVKVGDPAKWLTFDVMARTAPSGYRNLTVVNTGGSSASPFAAGDGVLLFFQRNGDIGIGSSAVVLLASAKVTAAVSTLDFLNIFSASYDRYQIEIQGMRPGAASVLNMRLAANGSLLLSGYVNAGVPAQVSSASNTILSLSSAPVHPSYAGANFTIDVRNANGTGIKSVGVRGVLQDSPNAYFTTVIAEGLHSGASSLSGFQLVFSGGTIVTGTVCVFGFKNNF